MFSAGAACEYLRRSSRTVRACAYCCLNYAAGTYRGFNIHETTILYYNGLISVLCREKSFARQGLVVFFALMFKSLIISALLAVPAAFAAAQPAADPGSDKSLAEKINAAGTENNTPAREKLYQELGESRDAAAVAVLSRAALGDPEPGARIDAVLALRKIGGPAALKGLLEVLSAEKHKGVRIQAVNSLGFFSAPEALARLRDIAVNDPDKDLRVAAVLALSRLGDAQTLTAGFDSEKDPAVKLAIVDAVGRTEEGEKELGKIRAKNKDPKVTKRLNLYAPVRKVVKKATQNAKKKTKQKAPTGGKQ